MFLREKAKESSWINQLLMGPEADTKTKGKQTVRV